jgi:hypothetical protein
MAEESVHEKAIKSNKFFVSHRRIVKKMIILTHIN